MRQRVLTLLSLLAVALIAVAQPRFVPANEILKVGEVAFQQPKIFHLPFSNKGNEPLLIRQVNPSCGCLNVEFPTTPIAPEATGEVVVTFDAQMLGSFYKDIELITNASDQPAYMAIQGYVVKDLTDYSADFPIDLGNIRMQTDHVEFDDVHRGQTPTAQLTIVNTERTAFRPQLMHLPPYLNAECEPEMIPPGHTGTIRLTLDSEHLPTMGLTQTSIYLSRYMGDKIGEANEIAVSAVLLPSAEEMSSTDEGQGPELYVTEHEVQLGKVGKKETLRHDVLLLNMGNSPLTIHQVQVFSKALSVSLNNRTIQPGKSAKLRITLDKQRLRHEKNRPRVLLISNDPNHPKEIIEVEVL